MKKLLCGAVALALFGNAFAQNAVSGSTDFRVTLPEILVLYHWDDAHLTLTDPHTFDIDNDSDAEHEISDTSAHDLSSPLSSATTSHTLSGYDVDQTETNHFNANQEINVVLENAWAVRSLSSGDVTLGLTVQSNGELLNVTDPSSKILVKANTHQLRYGATTSDSLTLAPGWSPKKGNIEFTLDLSAANHSGEYNTRGSAGPASTADEATDVFLLTLTGN